MAPSQPPAKLDLTAFQKALHGMSSQQKTKRQKTKGAFGGCTREERALRSIKRRFWR